MWRKLLTKTDAHKRRPHTVTGMRIEQVGSKYYIYADVEALKPRVIGRYNTLSEAQAALQTVENITKSNNLT